MHGSDVFVRFRIHLTELRTSFVPENEKAPIRNDRSFRNTKPVPVMGKTYENKLSMLSLSTSTSANSHDDR